ncbi:MAG: hypothetical protein H0V18_05520 [Pyrinomonadaceae bacterium]|nr:hypothetical protein [Pyrinomonadaceae bacterium]
MKRKMRKFLCAMSLGLVLSFAGPPAKAQDNSNSSKGEIKKSGSEVKRAGRSLGRNVKHGRIVRGGKHFGKHMGRAGKHFGRSTKKAVKKVVS